MHEMMAELRQWLAQEPSYEVWQSVCEMLDTWPDSESLPMAEEYVKAHMDASWDDRLRIPYASWDEGYAGWKLVRQPRRKLETLPGAEEVFCPPGSFLRGSEEDDQQFYSDEWPRATVSITHGMWVAETPVTLEQWAVFFSVPEQASGGKTHPVNFISWYEAAAFCNALSEAEGLEPAFEIEVFGDARPGEGGFSADVQWKGIEAPGYRLPTEAEWEYLCRAGADNQWYMEELDPIGWHYHISDHSTHPVKQKIPNKWGLYDILGNVCEWCLDSGDENNYPGTYNSGEYVDLFYMDKRSTHRIFRGGSWDSIPKQTRAAYRDHREVSEHSDRQGLRVLRTDLTK